MITLRGIASKFKNFFFEEGEPRPERTKRQASMTTSTSRDRDPRQNRGRYKYGPIRYNEQLFDDPAERRETARQVYNESLIARGIKRRFVNNVINTGLSWESTPIWDMIPDAPKSEDERYALTRKLENQWMLYAKSKEADITGQQTFQQMQRLLFGLHFVEGEFTTIPRYLNATGRISPVSLQVLQNDQISTPYKNLITQDIEGRGGKIRDGFEYNSLGQPVAIYVQEDLTKDHVRIPMYGPKSGRTFVLHCANIENPSQARGFPELSALVYELSRLTEYDIAELEAVVASALWMGVVTADKDAAPGKHPNLKPNVPNKDTSDSAPKAGIETVEIGQRALIMNNLAPGYTFQGFQPNRPNPNYAAFVEAFETRLCGAVGMPVSVFKQKFDASYSAARAEILFFWNEIITRRAEFVDGFLSEYHRIVFTEWEKTGKVDLPGFNVPEIRQAWLYGVWTGISRPVVDPTKEQKAVEGYLNLGLTTHEREAEIHNGSDYRENIQRLKAENVLLAEVNAPLEPVVVDPNATPDQPTDTSNQADMENQPGGNQ